MARSGGVRHRKEAPGFDQEVAMPAILQSNRVVEPNLDLKIEASKPFVNWLASV
jgi:hypothetical protein